MLLAIILTLTSAQETPEKGEQSAVDRMVSAIEAAGPSASEIDAIDAERRARLAKLRAKASARSTTGRVVVDRTREQEADAAFLAVSDLDDLLRKDGKLAADPYAVTAQEGPTAKLTANWVARHQSFCSHALRMDDPLKALAIEARGLMLSEDERLSLAITCRIYWTAFDRAVYQGE